MALDFADDGLTIPPNPVLLVGALAVLVACWWGVFFPPRTDHQWDIEAQNGTHYYPRGDHMETKADPILAGYQIVTIYDAGDRVIGVYTWVFNVKETR